MKCPRCQEENPPQARFCHECAAPLALACSSCGAPLPASARFCPGCGHPAPAGARGLPRFVSPEAYTPGHLAEKILTSKAALEGERKLITVLFADLKSSLELLADRDPEEARALLDPVLAHMMDAVHRYEGTVNQVMGDGIMALFGAPLAHEDHAVRACYAALGMQDAVKQYADGIRRAEGIPIRIRVGLNSGEVVVRAIGSDLHMDYSAVGQTTHLAARMEQLADPGSILLTSDTLALAEGFVHVTPLGPVAVRGLSAPIEVYELTGASAVRSRFQAAAARGLTRFVGRAPELDVLLRALAEARAGHGQLVAVAGEPGVGKSRLFWELTHSHRTSGWLLLESHSVSYGEAIPYLPVIDLLKAYFRVQDGDDHREIREKLIGKILALDRALEPTLPAFLALLGVPVEDPAWEALESAQRRRRTQDAVRRLLLRESQVQPVLLVFEDLHWIDGETRAFLDGLVESLPRARVLLLVNYRPEYRHEWGSKSWLTQLRLDTLSSRGAGELLEHLLGVDPTLDLVKRVLTDRTGGNPLFLEESVRTLVETGALVGTRGAYRLTQPVEQIEVPATVQAILAARIDRLPPVEKSVLQLASVMGEDVPLALLQAVAGLPEEPLREALAHLQAAEFLCEASLFPHMEYTFRHGLTYQVAYGGLLREHRRALHARIVEASEALYADHLADQAERIATHALRGEVWGKALTYCRRAGARAFARSAHGQAVAYLEQALAALGHLPDSVELREEAIDLRFELRHSLLALGEHQRVLGTLKEAAALAQSLGDPRRAGWLACYETIQLWTAGDPDGAGASGQRALALARRLGDVPLEAVAHLGLGWTHFALGEYRRAIDSLRRTIELLEGRFRLERFGLAALPAVGARTYLALSLGEVGEFSAGLGAAREAIEIANALDDPWSQASAELGAGLVHLRRRDLVEALPPLEHGLELCRLHGIRSWLVGLASALGYAYGLAGRVPEGLALLMEAAAESAAMKATFRHSLRLAWLGEIQLKAGHHEEASRLARQALELAHLHKERGHEAHVHRLLGEIALESDLPDPDEARGHYRRALALAGPRQMRPLEAACWLGLGLLSRRIGDLPAARSSLASAAELFRAIDSRAGEKRAEAEIRALY